MFVFKTAHYPTQRLAWISRLAVTSGHGSSLMFSKTIYRSRQLCLPPLIFFIKSKIIKCQRTQKMNWNERNGNINYSGPLQIWKRDSLLTENCVREVTELKNCRKNFISENIHWNVFWQICSNASESIQSLLCISVKSRGSKILERWKRKKRFKDKPRKS